jgi:mannose-1-phosphate guanylyltransferase
LTTLSGSGQNQQGNIIGNVLIHPTAKIHPEAVIGPNVTIGEKCVVNKGARIMDSCLLGYS